MKYIWNVQTLNVYALTSTAKLVSNKKRYLKKIGLKPTDRKLSLHSFRHSVETDLTEQNVNPRYIDYLQGHAQNGVGGDVYLKGIPPEQLLKNCVQKIDRGIDFSQLKIKLK